MVISGAGCCISDQANRPTKQHVPGHASGPRGCQLRHDTHRFRMISRQRKGGRDCFVTRERENARCGTGRTVFRAEDRLIGRVCRVRLDRRTPLITAGSLDNGSNNRPRWRALELNLISCTPRNGRAAAQSHNAKQHNKTQHRFPPRRMLLLQLSIGYCRRRPITGAPTARTAPSGRCFISGFMLSATTADNRGRAEEMKKSRAKARRRLGSLSPTSGRRDCPAPRAG
jgi:hypothetical protein